MSVALMIRPWLTKARKNEFATFKSEPIIYPESDGQPMAESDIHRDYMVDVIETLKDRYRNQNNVYVSGNLFIYYEKGVKSSVFSPDAFVIFGVPKKRRRSYKLWEEGNKVPDVVFEVTSSSTWLEDEGNKKTLCRRLGVREYFMYDPKGEYLNPRLQGSRLERGVYLSLMPDAQGRLYSETLDLYLQLEDGQLRLIDRQTGERLLTSQEARDARREAEKEIARLRAELERLRQQTD